MKSLISSVVRHFRYLPHARKHYGQLGALTIIGALNATRGIAVAETGINVSRFVVRFFGYVNDRLNGITGEVVVRGVSQKFSREVTAEGEVTGATGIIAFTLAAIVTFANSVTLFGGAGNAGIFLLDEATDTQERDAWHRVSVRASSDPLLTSLT